MSSNKIALNQPTLFMLYGYPGVGKTYFARQFCETINAAHVQGERIRYELFERPRFDKQENEIVSHLMEYLTEEFLKVGISVVLDTNAMRLVQRRKLREMARRHRANHLLIWLQIDLESALARASKRDRRHADDKYTPPITKGAFEQRVAFMQNPKGEDYMVISGKHAFSTQRSAVIKRLYEQSLVNASGAAANVIKPALVNLVPQRPGGRVDISRRNIIIR